MESKTENLYDNEIDLVELARPVFVAWKFILIVAIFCGLIAFFYSRTLPEIYQSKATFFVQQNSSVSSLVNSLPIAGLGASSGQSGYFLTILQSNTLKRQVVRRLKLVDNRHFMKKCPNGLNPESAAVEALTSATTINQDKNGSISLSVRAQQPKLAADIANAMLDQMEVMVIRISTRKSDFIEERIDETKTDLAKAEDDMSRFLEKNQVASIDEQTKLMVDKLSKLDADLLDVNTKLQGLYSELATAGNLDDLVNKEVSQKSLEATRDYIQNERTKLTLQIEKLPETATKYARIQRRVAVLSKTYELLTEQYQIAQITQKGEDGDYQIIDRARPNPEKVAPSNTSNAIFGFLVGMLIMSVVLLIRSRINRKKRSRTNRSTYARPIENTPAKR
ncbi:hypothetical protein LLG46_06610 [bacterium]|nr:hypothetical protein [bacterium]